MALHLGVTEDRFIQEFTRIDRSRTGLALMDQPGGECIFLQGTDCRVQPVKPQQCRDFPNLWNFPGFEKTCRSIPRVLEEAEYRRRIREATGREIPGVDSRGPGG